RRLRTYNSDSAETAAVGSETICQMSGGNFDEPALLSIAPVLGLSGSALCELARRKWHPKKIEGFEGLAQFNTDYGGMAVNAYLTWDPATRVAAGFDTGADSKEMVRFANRHRLNVQLIFLTHAHADHVADLPCLREETGADVFTPMREPVPGT